MPVILASMSGCQSLGLSLSVCVLLNYSIVISGSLQYLALLVLNIISLSLMVTPIIFGLFPLHKKSEVQETLVAIHAYLRTQFDLYVGTFQADNGREFSNSLNLSFLQQHGIFLRLSCPYASP